MKPIDVISDSYAEYNEDYNKKDPKFNVGDHDRISKYKNIFITKIFLLKDTLKIGQKLLLVKLKTHFCGILLLVT